jgi:hypothetical protein
MSNDFIFTCLHCKEDFIVAKKDFNCKVLRHGVLKHTMQPMNPHASQKECEQLVRDGKIYGCGKPLRIIKTDGKYIVEICDYL